MTTQLNTLKLYTIAALIVANLPAFAQDTLRTDWVDVVKAFKPILSESMKIQSNPNPEIPETQTPVFSYEVPEKRMDGQPTLYTIKPLSLGTSLLPKLKNNYTKIGYGNYNAPLFETYLNTTRNKNLQAGLFVKHLSFNPNGDRQFSNNTVYGFGKRFLGSGILSADALYYRNVVNLYGYKLPTGIKLADVGPNNNIKQKFQTIEGKVAYQNILKDTSKLSYKLDGGFYNFSDNRDVTENDFKLYGTFGKRINGNPLDIKTGVNISNLKFGNTEYNRVFVDINPRYKLNMDQLYINLGFNSTFFNDSTGTTFYFFPIAEAGINLIKNSLTTYVGITGNLQRNTYRSIANENPFVRSAGFRNTENSFELYGGLKGIISPQTSFLLNASLANVKNLLFYVGDSANLNSQKVVFDTKSSSVFNVKAELNHEFGNQFLLGFVMNYYSYSISIKAPYSMPTFTTQLNLGYNMSDKFLWKASVLTMNKRESGIEVAPNTINATTLKGFVDLNLGLDYRYTKNISLFVNLNNLTNNEYERWVNLPVYGFNVMGGLTVSF
jgi:outer membrane receptor protein involved in Fe transport